jgi:hypothetical protein
VLVRGEALFEDRYLPQLGRVAIIKNVLFAVRDEAWRIPAFSPDPAGSSTGSARIPSRSNGCRASFSVTPPRNSSRAVQLNYGTTAASPHAATDDRRIINKK